VTIIFFDLGTKPEANSNPELYSSNQKKLSLATKADAGSGCSDSSGDFDEPVKAY
jgi:hypothetical protein